MFQRRELWSEETTSGSVTESAPQGRSLPSKAKDTQKARKTGAEVKEER